MRQWSGFTQLNYKHQAYIGIGSNVGNRVENCLKAITAIDACEGCMVDARSPLYETEPVEFETQDWFINGVLKIRTCLQPETLLARLQAIEQGMGREQGGLRFGPRIIDLDILFFDRRIIETDRLQIPHPRLHQRRFVLKPLCSIAPELVHPVLKKTASSLLKGLQDGEKKVNII